MSKNDIGPSVRNHKNISTKIEQVTFNSIRKVLPDSVIIQACKDVGHKYRRRKISPVITVLHMIISAIWPEESFNASWQMLWSSLVSWFPELKGESPSRSKVSMARARLPIQLWNAIFKWISQQAGDLSDKFNQWKGHRVILADGTCISMSDNEDLSNEFGRGGGGHGQGRFPLARLVTLCFAETKTIINYALGSFHQGEPSLLFSILESLKKGDLLVADSCFAAGHFYARYTSMGIEFLTKAHQALKISRIRRIESYGSGDFIGWLRINPNYRRTDRSLPEKVMVRFIQATMRIRGKRKVVWFVSSLLDNKKYSAKEIIELYSKRWRIETLLREVKVNLGVDVLRSQSPEGVRKEVAARLVAINIVRTIMIESAIEQNVDPLRISFAHAVRAIIGFSPALAAASIFQLPMIYKAMLVEIGTHLIPKRPGRVEPRATKRDWQHYPSLKIARKEWRKKYAA